MLYYRVACRVEETQKWKWKSTLLSSLQALFLLLRSYNAIPRERMRVFIATTKEHMDEMLRRENEGLISMSLPAVQMFDGYAPNSLDVARLEMELGSIGDNDEPYVFSIPSSIKEVKCWIELQRCFAVPSKRNKKSIR